ncbi:flagellar hook-length control protein FliK [Bacillus sp. ISL-47]|uniref:flagellar hook-length control protein FliK n=1 Tax=Bacillus sp. ISL-47 TaxID=2819130 RepID=UPI001BE5B818|nr:flagellar hook-length control protein FliK [Bacillus sp. ISL-47]MBT2708858.1 flagellar hook-length control protein FliK [Pseudomonas sp. ISL-84]
MEIGGLGIIHSQFSSGNKASFSGEKASGFASLFSTLISGGESMAANLAEEERLSEELEELSQFLGLIDLSELKNGQELIEQAALQTGTNNVSIIAEQLNLSMEELLRGLEGFAENLSPNIRLENVYDEAIESNSAEVKIDALIANISLLDVQEFSLIKGKEVGQILKALKLFDMLTAYQDSIGSSNNLKVFLKDVQAKLEGLLKNRKGSFDKAETLQKIFTPFIDEISQHKQKNSAGLENTGDSFSKILSRFDGGLQGHIQIQQFSKPEQLLMMHQQGKAVTADQLIQQFESILSKSSFLKTGGAQKLFIKLNPAHLGALRIELIQKDSTMIARILTSTASAKEILDSQLNGLKQAFSLQNLQVEKIEISQQMTQQERAFNKDPQHQGQGQQQNQENKNPQTESKFNNSFEEALLNTEV